jgi:mannan endo-1,4-beta-mannosidase
VGSDQPIQQPGPVRLPLAGYNVYRRVGTTDTQLTTSTTTSVTLTGLTAATAYQIVVRARDGAGNLSATSAVGSFTTGAAPTGSGCTVAYTIVGQWTGGFQGEIKITNNGSTAINGWTLAFAFPNGQTLTQMWGGTYVQSGANVTVTNVSYTAALGANGGAQTLGFLANSTTTNAKPVAFALNGTACTVA